MAQNNKNKKGKGTDWKKEILKFLNDNPSGYTITNIAERIGTTRITVSKYLALLEQENKVISKEIGVYKLYFSKVRKYLELDLIRSFYSAFLSGVKAKFGSDNEKFKKVGYFISDSFYKYLLDGDSKAVALKNAKIDMINSNYSHPFYWAAFILSGEYRSAIF